MTKTIQLKDREGTALLPLALIAVSHTWAELVALRDAGTLVPGVLYRITDYVTTTTQADTQSAGHQYDIIVKALSATTLSEHARAIRHDGDAELSDAVSTTTNGTTTKTAYFANSRLEAWRLLYCIDNDTARFAWADATNGKGVVYRLKDEFRNDCPYDFKNIQFKRYKVTATTISKATNLTGKYLGMKAVNGSSMYPQKCTISTTDTAWRYTFDSIAASNSSSADYSLDGGYCHDNSMEPYVISNNAKRQWLQSIIVTTGSKTASCYNNAWGAHACALTFGSACYDNTFSGYVQYNTFSGYVRWNTFSGNVQQNTFSGYVDSNTFSGDVYNNTFSGYVQYNTFSGYVQQSTFSGNVQQNTFSGDVRWNTFSGYVYNNTFSGYVQQSTFSGNVYNNTFSGNVYNNTFSGYVQQSTFSGDVYNNTFSGNVLYCSFEGESQYIAWPGGTTQAEWSDEQESDGAAYTDALMHVRQTGRIGSYAMQQDENGDYTINPDMTTVSPATGVEYEQIVTRSAAGAVLIKTWG